VNFEEKFKFILQAYTPPSRPLASILSREPPSVVLFFCNWYHKRFSVGQPKVDLSEYGWLPAGHDPTDRCT
jgi:hypothetical protein